VSPTPAFNAGAPVVLTLEQVLDLPPEELWGLLVEVGLWPSLHPGTRMARLSAGWTVGSQLLWQSDGLRFYGVVTEAAPGSRAGWTFRTMGAHGYQRWTIEEVAEGRARLRLEESWEGGMVRLFSRTLRRTLSLSRKAWFAGLEGAASGAGEITDGSSNTLVRRVEHGESRVQERGSGRGGG